MLLLGRYRSHSMQVMDSTVVNMDKPTFLIPESQLIQLGRLVTATLIKPDRADTQPIQNKHIRGNQEYREARVKAKAPRVEEERARVMRDQRIGSNIK